MEKSFIERHYSDFCQADKIEFKMTGFCSF